MYVPYPKSWVKKPENYIPKNYNDILSENDTKLLNKWFDLSVKSGDQKDF